MSEPGAARDALPADALPADAAEKDAVRMEAVRIDGPSGPLIDGLDFRAVAGRRTIILGANGAGKSLALRLIQGLIAPTAGRVDVAGRPALVFQRPVLLRRSLRANILHALKIAGASSALRRERAGDLLELAGLTALAERPARVLSGGEQQRAALARALAAEPDILLLDEPTASLDPHAVQAFESIVSDVHAAGATILFVTHDRGQAKRLADDVIFLEKGRVVEAGPAGPFFERPATEAARAYMEGRLRIP